jgi:hypothetical protein
MTRTLHARGRRIATWAGVIVSATPLAVEAADCAFLETLLSGANSDFNSIRDRTTRDGSLEDSRFLLPGARACYLNFEEKPSTYTCQWEYSRFSKEPMIAEQARNLALLVAQCAGELSEGYQSKDDIPRIVVRIPKTDMAYEIYVSYQIAGTPGHSQTSIRFSFAPEYLSFSEQREVKDPRYWSALSKSR